MWDKKALHEQCFKHKIEFAEDTDNRIIFLCPKMPDEKVKVSLVQMLPKTIDFRFIISPKLSTTEALKVLLRDMGIDFTGLMIDGLFKIQSNVSIPDDHPFWKLIVEILSRDDYFTGWKITIGKKTITYSHEMVKRIRKNTRKRDHSITMDEIKDLHISLNLESKDVNDVIKELFPDETN